MSAVAGDVIQH